MEAGGDTTEIGVVGARDSLGEDASQESVPASDETSGTSRKADPVLDSSTGVNEETDLRYMNVGGNFYTGIDVTSEDTIRKREERAKRFGIEAEQSSSTSDHRNVEDDVTKFQARSKRFGTELLLANGQPVKFVKSLPSVPAGKVRPMAVHLHGSGEMSTEDVLEFFTLYSPRNIEWINDQSCNAVWEDEMSAKRALIGLGRTPLAVMDDKTQSEREAAKDEDGREEGEGESSLSIQWWLAPPHPRAQRLLVRQATTGDLKKPGSAGKSQYYKKYGNPNEINIEPIDLRDRLGKKRTRNRGAQSAGEEEEKEESMEMESSLDPLALLVKRPKPMHADRDDDEVYGEDENLRGQGNEGGGGEGAGGTGDDLRKLLKKKRKRRDLKMRLGNYPRLVEEHR